MLWSDFAHPASAPNNVGQIQTLAAGDRRGERRRTSRGNRVPPNGSLAQPRRGPPVSQRQSGAPLAATSVKTAGSVCKRRDAVRLGRKKGLQPRANERPAVGCSEKLGGRQQRDRVCTEVLIARYNDQVVLQCLADQHSIKRIAVV